MLELYPESLTIMPQVKLLPVSCDNITTQRQQYLYIIQMWHPYLGNK